jgi:luciferase family oxidoreductase group 1
MTQAVEMYRQMFRPSQFLDKPYVMLGLNVFAADTHEEARLLYTSLQQAFVNLRSGRPGMLPPPVQGYEQQLGVQEKALIASALSCSVVGTREEVAQGLEAFAARTGADELMVTAQIFDHAARLRSYRIAAEACGQSVPA